MQLKETIFHILYTPKGKKGWIYKIDDYFITGLIILNVIAIIIASYQDIYNSYRNFFKAFEIFSVIIFTLEYILRLWVSDLRFPNMPGWKARFKYVFSAMGLIDILAIMPFYLPRIIPIDLRFIRILRVLRLLRVLKIAHYADSLKLVGRVFNSKKEELLITLLGTFILLLITSSVMYEIERDVQPDQFPNIFATFWWAVATLTTIGYGDVYPVTGWGRFLAALTAIFGIGIVAIPTGLLSVGFLEEIEAKKRKKSTKSHKAKNFKHLRSKKRTKIRKPRKS
jgi:voltage-gated potassium channel